MPALGSDVPSQDLQELDEARHAVPVLGQHLVQPRTSDDELRERLRAARRQLDAGERREKALRRNLQQLDLPPLQSHDTDDASTAHAGAERAARRPRRPRRPGRDVAVAGGRLEVPEAGAAE